MYKKTKLRNGKIPANMECPWKDTCQPAKDLECRHVGINKLRDFKCPHIASNEVLDNLGAAPKVKTRTKFEYCVTEVVAGTTQKNLLKICNTRGALGWELCGDAHGFFIFKREFLE